MSQRPAKSLKTLPLSDNFMFGEVMTNPEVCKMFLEEVLQKKIARIEFVNREQTITNVPGMHGIRLDVYAEDEEDTRYNVEMQAKWSRYKADLEPRARFYQSGIDRLFLTSGGDYENLPNSYIIFICDYDYFKRGLACYERVSSIKDCPEITYDDGTHVMFFNTHYKTPNVSKDVREFLDYIRTNDDQVVYEGELARRARELVWKVRSDETMEVKYMTFQMYLDERCREVAYEVEERVTEEVTERVTMQKAKEGICAVADLLSPAELAKRFKVSLGFVKEVLSEAGIAPLEKST